MKYNVSETRWGEIKTRINTFSLAIKESDKYYLIYCWADLDSFYMLCVQYQGIQSNCIKQTAWKQSRFSVSIVIETYYYNFLKCKCFLTSSYYIEYLRYFANKKMFSTDYFSFVAMRKGRFILLRGQDSDIRAKFKIGGLAYKDDQYKTN